MSEKPMNELYAELRKAAWTKASNYPYSGSGADLDDVKQALLDIINEIENNPKGFLGITMVAGFAATDDDGLQIMGAVVGAPDVVHACNLTHREQAERVAVMMELEGTESYCAMKSLHDIKESVKQRLGGKPNSLEELKAAFEAAKNSDSDSDSIVKGGWLADPVGTKQ